MQTATQFTALFLVSIAAAVGLGASLAASADARSRPALRALLPDLSSMQLAAANAAEPPLPSMPAPVAPQAAAAAAATPTPAPQPVVQKPVFHGHSAARLVSLTRVAHQR